jgi:hypothetical protein
MSSPYRSAQIEAPTSFALTAALNVAWCAVGLRAVAALCEAFATQNAAFERPALALVLGACGAVGVAAARLARVHPERAGRALSMGALASALVSVLGWQPLVGWTDGYGPGLSSLGEHGSRLWSASSWAGAGLLLVVSLIAPATRATARRDAAEREESALARAAQAQSLRAFSSSALGVVFSMVLSILLALAVEQTALHWHWSSAVRAAGMIASALFGVRALRAASRLHGWAPSVLSTSVGFSLWIAAVVGAAFVLREWSAVLWSQLGRAHIVPGFAAQGMVAWVTLAALGAVVESAWTIEQRADRARRSWSSLVAAVSLAATLGLLMDVHRTIPDFMMRTPAHFRLVLATLASAALTVVLVAGCARRAAAALDAKSSERAKKSD